MIDETNQQQNNALADLKARIEARRALQVAYKADINPFKKVNREIFSVPEIKTPKDDNGLFSLERYTELKNRVDILYCNYLTRLEELQEQIDSFEFKGLREKTNAFEVDLKELAMDFDEMIEEGCKPRWS